MAQPAPRPPSPRSGAARAERRGSTAVVVVESSDWLDVSTGPDVERVVADAVRAAPGAVVVDLTRCSMVDPYGLGVLLRARRTAEDAGAGFSLLGANPRVRHVLELTGLTDELPVTAPASAGNAS